MPGAVSVDLFRGYDPHPKARVAFLDDARFCLLCCGRRGAKTHTGCRRLLRLIYERDLPAALNRSYYAGAAKRGTALWWKRRPRLHYWVVADTYDLLKEPIRYFLEFLPPELLEHADLSGAPSIWIYPDILIEFKTGHDPSHLVGSGLDGIWIEEGARLAPNAWKGFMRPLLSDKQGWAQCTTTPLGQDWTYDDFELPALRQEAGYSFHTWTTADNIRVPGMLADIEEARRLLPPTYFKREYEASRDAFEGQIYPFDESMIHDSLPSGLQLVIRLAGQDWGFTAPGAHIVLGLTNTDPNKAHVWALDEVYDKSQLVEQFWVPETKKKMALWKYNEVAADPAEPDNIERYKAAGIRCVGHKNYSTAKFDEHERSVRAGIRVMAALMHQKRFHVLRRCTNLIAELKSYRWDQYKAGSQGGVLIERPAPGQKEHAATACRYGVTYGLKGAVFVPLGFAAAA